MDLNLLRVLYIKEGIGEEGSHSSSWLGKSTPGVRVFEMQTKARVEEGINI